MPDLDGAHGFLTVLLPLHTEPCARGDDSLTSPVHAVRELLASWPTAQHSRACAGSGLQSPFARSAVTHLARLAVIDQPAFNGRDPRDAVLTALNVGPPLTADPPVDSLQRPYLLFCADFDRDPGAATSVRAYLLDLWSAMAGEWSALLAHCEGWRPGGGAADFAAYLADCQVETTMPFNDYAVAPPKGGSVPPLLAPAGAAGLAFLVALLLIHGLAAGLPPAAAWLLGGLAGLAAAVTAGVAVVGWLARRSSPWTTGLDLRTILKSLELQARFTRFAIDHQGAGAVELQTPFRMFLQQARPDDQD